MRDRVLTNLSDNHEKVRKTMRALIVAVLTVCASIGSVAEAATYCPFTYCGFLGGRHYYMCYVGANCSSGQYATVSSPRLHVLGCTYSGGTSTCIDPITTNGNEIPHVDFLPGEHKTHLKKKLGNIPGIGDDLESLGKDMPVATFVSGSASMRVRADFVMAEKDDMNNVKSRYRIVIVQYDSSTPRLFVFGQQMEKNPANEFDVVGARQKDAGGNDTPQFKVGKTALTSGASPLVPADIHGMLSNEVIVNTLDKK